MLMAVLAGWPASSVGEQAPPSEAPAKPSSGDVDRLLGQLDSNEFHVRRQAAAKLEELATRPELRPLLAAQIERILVLPDTSFEVRSRLERLRSKLPAAPAPPPESVTPEEIDRLVRQLEDESYGLRLAATKRLQWMLSTPELVCPILTRLKGRLAGDGLSADARRWLDPICERARDAWLLGNPAAGGLPEVSDDKIAEWVGALTHPAPPNKQADGWHVHQTAKQELSDLLARQEYVPRVKQALARRLKEPGLDPKATARLKELADLTRPAMVAEYWSGRRHQGEQHLLIGVPSLGPGAQRPSHFDRIDDRVVHCVSGHTLTPGEYLVGVAFPHPLTEDALFHLVNLPTPRRRLAYARYVRTDEARRLAALSRRTLDRFLTRNEPLGEAELVMLGLLDAEEVSRFAGKLFNLIDDQPLPAKQKPPTAYGQPRVRRQRKRPGGQPSRHGILCEVLAVSGTREAITGLLEAIDAERFLPPTEIAPYRLHWLAALSIARRDPWPEVDSWLAGLIGRTDALVEGRTDAPELGATAATVLLMRHQGTPGDFGLGPIHRDLMQKFNVPACRFVSPEGRAKVQRWWAERQLTKDE